MAYSVNEAKQLVVKAGIELVKSGLIARTWGNVSARISDTQFIITPSGRPYETLTEDELVTVNISDCSYEGDIKPSSEKGIHAAAYKARPEVNFIIHTHQVKASVISVTGEGIDNVPSEYKTLLGPSVPNAAYGMPSTDKLKKGVEEAVIENPNSKAVIMRHHGTMCMGLDYDNAFEIALALEKLCDETIKENYLSKSNKQSFDSDEMLEFFLRKKSKKYSLNKNVGDLGNSSRSDDKYTVVYTDGSSYTSKV